MDKLKKVLAWRMLSILVASTVSVGYMGEWERPLILTGLLTVIMTALHYVFELVWDNCVPGKNREA
jgi:uncharacterized membrane protein